MGKLEESVKQYGKELGFDVVGITTARPFVRDEQATHPEALLPEARSVISLAMSYFNGDPEPDEEVLAGKVGRYAWEDDYHHVLKARLGQFVEGLSRRVGRPVNDRAAAERAGVGWFGKNTNILTPNHGSWVLLGQVITDLDLEPDRPLAKTWGIIVDFSRG